MKTPGQLLRDLREIQGRSRAVFGDFAGWGENIQRHLEDGRTRFTMEHLNELLESDILERPEDKEKWRKLFVEAMEAMVLDVEVDPPGPVPAGETVTVTVSSKREDPVEGILIAVNGLIQYLAKGRDCVYQWNTSETKAGEHTLQIAVVGPHGFSTSASGGESKTMALKSGDPLQTIIDKYGISIPIEVV